MADARTTLDAARAKVPPDAKLLVAWVADGVVHAAQSNMSQADVRQLADSLARSALPQTRNIVRAG